MDFHLKLCNVTKKWPSKLFYYISLLLPFFTFQTYNDTSLIDLGPKLAILGAFLVFNHLNRTSLIDHWIWCGFALINYLDDCDLGD